MLWTSEKAEVPRRSRRARIEARIAHAFLGDSPEMSEAERAFVRTWIFRNAPVADRRIVLVSIWLTLAAIVAVVIYFRGELRVVFTVSHAIAIFLMIACYRAPARWFRPKILHVGLVAGLVGSMTYAARDVMRDDPSQTVAALTTVLALSLGNLRLAPLSGLFYLLCIAFLECAIVFAMLGGDPVGRQFAVVSTVALLVAVSHESVRVAHLEREALLEFRTRALAVAAEKARNEQELSLAREVQASALAPAGELVVGGWSAKWRRETASPLGGDWIGVMSPRQVSGEPADMIVAIADVTGKGVGAALVVHALQSLWTSAELSGTFDAGAWIHTANATLHHLGKSSAQTSTLGLLVVRDRQLTFWSAAHLPLFAVGTDGVTMDVKALTGRGSLLGFNVAANVTPVAFELDAKRDWSLVLASDGFLPQGTRTSRKVVEMVACDLSAWFADQAGSAPDDDRSVIVLKRKKSA